MDFIPTPAREGLIIGPFVALLVGLSAHAGIELTLMEGPSAAVWPANAFLFVALWRLIGSLSPVILALSFSANVFVILLHGYSFVTALVLSSANTFEVALSFVLLGIAHKRWPQLQVLCNILSFLCLVCIVAPACSALLSAGYMSTALGADFLGTWLTWFQGNSLWMVTLGVTLMHFSWQEFTSAWSTRRNIVLNLVVWVAFVWILDWVFTSNHLDLLFLAYPLLMMAVFTGGISSAYLALVMAASVTIYSSAFKVAPTLDAGADLVEQTFLLEGFLGLCALTILPLGVMLRSQSSRVVELIKARQLAETMRAMAEGASDAKSNFLTSMSHELRTPLNAIYGFGQILEANSKNLDASQKEHVDTIVRSSLHLISMVDDILDLAKIENGKMPIHRSATSVSEILEQTRRMLKYPAVRQKVTITVAHVPDGLCVYTDPARLLQIMLNLVGNAIKYNRPGGEVLLDFRDQDGWVTLLVQDDGIGISPEFRRGVFEAFNRCGAEFGNVEGAGVGLALCKNLTDAMGGHIGYRSTPGAGSVFWCKFNKDGEDRTNECHV